MNRRAFLKRIGIGSAAYVIASQFMPSSVSASTGEGGTAINITDFLNNGQTIQDAINAVQNAGGGELFFPPGVYRTDRTLQITGDNVILRGANRDSSIIAPSGSLTNQNLLLIRKSGGRILNTKLVDLTLTSDVRYVFGNTAGSATTGPDISTLNHAVVLDGSHNVILDNMRIHHFNGDGISFQDTVSAGGPDQTIINNCVLSLCRDGVSMNNTGHSTHIYGGSYEFNTRYGINTGGRNSVFIKDADIEQNLNVGIRISHQSNIVIRDCTFENNARGYANDSTQRTHIWVGDYDVARSIVIDGCFFHGRSMRSLIRVDKADGVSITNNYVDFANQFGTANGAFVQTSATCRNVFVDDFSYNVTPNVRRISNPQYALSDIKPSSVTALPAPNEAIRGFMVRVEASAGQADALYMCVKDADGSYKWGRINMTF
ncbi:right-handed parallel beta-helix repeat-containing protein [Paenibacillus xanthanilyticus]|uniref:Right-handed parallel beta-helix repeat-containing protein n=1 Tax=Paenibacillus xanthanilyticus TaxID=1783531 RepID=A0ABV8KAW5_9BACL